MENIESGISTKHKWSLVAVLLMAPLVPSLLKSGDYGLEEKEKKFIDGYVKYGYILDLIFLVGFVLSIINVSKNILIVSYIISILVSLGIIGIIVGIFMVFADKEIFGYGKENIVKTIRSGNTNFLFYYIPILNFFLWENKKDNKSFWWLKESILLNILLIFINIAFHSILLNIIFIGFYIFRVIALFGGLDIINDKIKEIFNNLFESNPEEIWGYIKGSISYFYLKTQGKLGVNKMLATYIDLAKSEYKRKEKINNYYLIAEYIILAIIVILSIRSNIAYINLKISGLITLLPWLILIGRYTVLIPGKKLPHIPLIYELVIGIKKLINFIK